MATLNTLTTASFWEEISSAAGQDRRREKRVALVFPIVVHALERTGRFSSERTTTLNISEFGLCFETSLQVEPGSVLAIRLLDRLGDVESARVALFQIEWIKPAAEGDRWIVGASNIKRQSFWHMTFPREN